jgi:hypothetical protein
MMELGSGDIGHDAAFSGAGRRTGAEFLVAMSPAMKQAVIGHVPS